MLQLILIIFIILIIIAIICMNFNNVENFKDNKKSLNYLSLNILIDIVEKINTIKTVLNETEIKLNYDIAILNETKSISSGGYVDEMETLNSKVARLESYKIDIDDKIQKIDKIKDSIYQKLPKNLIDKIEEIAELNVKYKNIYKNIIEITTKRSFTKIKKEIKTDLEKLEQHAAELRPILLDVITRFY